MERKVKVGIIGCGGICNGKHMNALTNLDYVEIVDWRTLENVTVIEGPILAAMAVYIGKTRLIDNFIME